MSDFKFNMNDTVTLVTSKEYGTVVGRAEFRATENSYLVLYCANDGLQVQKWWDESTLALTSN